MLFNRRKKLIKFNTHIKLFRQSSRIVRSLQLTFFNDDYICIYNKNFLRQLHRHVCFLKKFANCGKCLSEKIFAPPFEKYQSII